MKNFFSKAFMLLALSLQTAPSFSQITERETPSEWNNLIDGARFKDRFLPMKGNNISSDVWGAQCVLPRYIDNGIEDNIWSYWGGNIQAGKDGKYHLIVCGWLEASPKGHMEWPDSYVFNSVSDNPNGPFKPVNIIGKGHNPEVYQLKDGRYVLYVINGRYVSDDLNGKWEYGNFSFNNRDRKIVEGLSNLSFAQREDGSYLMVCRGGGIWVSRYGLDEYCQISDESVYPKVEGRFEDPVLWRDSIQYHLIVNDWLGRIAYYLRSKNGLEWVVDDGEAYVPGIARHENGDTEDWFKFERLKILQDEYGRAVQANFAVIDTLKHFDKPFDKYSSKNISIPLNPGVLMTILNEKVITASTKSIKIKIAAEPGFNPQTDIDLPSLRFGSSKEVNYGRGCSVVDSENKGRDLIVTFSGKGNGIDENEFAPKLIGKYKNGNMLYGFARLPYLDYNESLLSARAPVFNRSGKSINGNIRVDNFGQVESQKATVRIECVENGRKLRIAEVAVPQIGIYDKAELSFDVRNFNPEDGREYDFEISVYSGKKLISTLKNRQKF